MTDGPLKDQLEDAFGLGIERMSRARGGDIAASYLLETQHGRFFAKCMADREGWNILKAEVEGLRAIGETRTIKVPNVLGTAALQSGGCLLLEYIPVGQGSMESFVSLGRGLAQMHRTTAPEFGWPNPNYIGSLPQENTPSPDWTSFYVQQRLMPQYRMALDKGLLSQEEVPDDTSMVSRIHGMLPEIQPALLHGDLWNGNYLIDTAGVPYLIDPSVHFGHAEVDLAMSLLFGGFPPAFYEAYFEVAPKEEGFKRRVALYQLYYLLVHLNLFGRSYHSRVREIGDDLFRR